MDESGARAVAEAFGKLFRDVHEIMRGQVRGLDHGTLNWRPLPKANSIAVLVTHTLGSQREMIRAVRLIQTERDRDSEFKAEADAARLLEMIDESDRDMSEMIAALTPSDLTDMRSRGDRPARPGVEWLVSNYGHSREHLAQIDLTKQLYDSRS